jgi:hypothetical protein
MQLLSKRYVTYKNIIDSYILSCYPVTNYNNFIGYINEKK